MGEHGTIIVSIIGSIGSPKHHFYRVFHVSTTFLIWLKMTLKCIGDMKERHFYNHKDPPFDMKHQLKSVDPVPVLKIDQKLTI